MSGGIYIALGSNIGDRRANLARAVAEIGRLPTTRLLARSPVYETAAVGGIIQDNFYNCVLEISTELPPPELLGALLRIETAVFDRQRLLRWGPRTMDLDLLLYRDLVIEHSPDLILPHPRLHERRFVLAPLADIAPDLVHPVLGRSMIDLLTALPPEQVAEKLQDLECDY